MERNTERDVKYVERGTLKRDNRETNSIKKYIRGNEKKRMDNRERK